MTGVVRKLTNFKLRSLIDVPDIERTRRGSGRAQGSPVVHFSSGRLSAVRFKDKFPNKNNY